MEHHKDDENPFALFVSWNPPHLPYELVPDEYYEKFKDADVCWRPNVPEEMRTPEMETKARQYFAAVYGWTSSLDESTSICVTMAWKKILFGTVCRSWRDDGIPQQNEQKHLV